MFNRIQWIAVVGIATAFGMGGFFGGMAYATPEVRKPGVRAVIGAEKSAPASATAPNGIESRPRATAPTELTFAQRLELGVDHQGEGPESGLIRQLRAEPKRFNFDGDVADTAAVKAWAGGFAHVLAIRVGLVDWKFGGMVGVREADKVSFLIDFDSDGKLTVKEYVSPMGDGNFGPAPTPSQTHVAADSIGASQFLGGTEDAPAQLPSYEYLVMVEQT